MGTNGKLSCSSPQAFIRLTLRPMERQIVHFQDLGRMEYKEAWDLQEILLQQNLKIKSVIHNPEASVAVTELPTKHHLLLVEHPPVYTLGKSGKIEHVLINEEERAQKGIQF